MRASFFDSSASLPMAGEKYVRTLPECGRCGFYKGCKSPKQKPIGKGKKSILIVSSHPTKEADELGQHLSGPDKEKLSAILRRNGLDLQKDCILTSALICKPHGKPDAVLASVNHCYPNLNNLIQDMKPKLIILLGRHAIKSLVTHLWHKFDSKMTMNMAGWLLRPHVLPDTWVIGTYHPNETHDQKESIANDMMIRHIEKGLKHLDRTPHPKGIPDYKKEITLLYKTEEIYALLKNLIRDKKPVAFDYETNMKKPDHWKSRIACMSVSNGKRSWAFLNTPDIKEFWIEFLTSDIPKVGFNSKFESRWSRRLFGVWPNNWIWDGMLDAHILDCRTFVTSLKWQAFARFGTPDYDSHIKPFLKSKEEGGYAENRVKDIPVDDLLYYCGLDSYLEYKVWKHQSKEYQRRTK